MHIGQTWAGSTQLTSFHMTAICKPATPCVEDSTDFFRMDADGMRYFGGDGRAATHVNYMTTLMSPEWLIKNPVAPGTMMGPGMGYQDADGWQVSVSGMHTQMGEQHHMSSYQALALETVTTPAGTFGNSLHIREQRGPDYVRDVWYAPGVGMVRWIDGVEEGLLASRTLPAQPVPPVTRVGRVLPCRPRSLLHDCRPGGDRRSGYRATVTVGSGPGWASMSWSDLPARPEGPRPCAVTTVGRKLAWTRTSIRRRRRSARR